MVRSCVSHNQILGADIETFISLKNSLFFVLVSTKFFPNQAKGQSCGDPTFVETPSAMLSRLPNVCDKM
jgi:hypothetical protein